MRDAPVEELSEQNIGITNTAGMPQTPRYQTWQYASMPRGAVFILVLSEIFPDNATPHGAHIHSKLWYDPQISRSFNAFA